MTQAVDTTSTAGWLTYALAEELRVQLARKRISGRELARRLHVSAQWVSQRTKGDVPLRADEMERISDTLGFNVADWFSDAARKGVTRMQTEEYSTASSTRPRLELLVRDESPSYQAVSSRNGSSDSANRLKVTRSAERVNNAHTA